MANAYFLLGICTLFYRPNPNVKINIKLGIKTIAAIPLRLCRPFRLTHSPLPITICILRCSLSLIFRRPGPFCPSKIDSTAVYSHHIFACSRVCLIRMEMCRNCRSPRMLLHSEIRSARQPCILPKCISLFNIKLYAIYHHY